MGLATIHIFRNWKNDDVVIHWENGNEYRMKRDRGISSYPPSLTLSAVPNPFGVDLI